MYCDICQYKCKCTACEISRLNLDDPCDNVSASFESSEYPRASDKTCRLTRGHWVKSHDLAPAQQQGLQMS